MPSSDCTKINLEMREIFRIFGWEAGQDVSYKKRLVYVQKISYICISQILYL